MPSEILMSRLIHTQRQKELKANHLWDKLLSYTWDELRALGFIHLMSDLKITMCRQPSGYISQ